MGSCTFSNSIVGKFDANEAYSVLVEDATYEYGHDPYNGTISTTHGFSLRTDAPRYGTKAFWNWKDKTIEAMGKGQCFAVEIKGKRLKEMKENRPYLKGKRGVRAFYFFGWASS